jgi:hypothetical protein
LSICLLSRFLFFRSLFCFCFCLGFGSAFADDAHDGLFSGTDIIQQRSVCRAGELSGSAFDAGNDIFLFVAFPILVCGQSSEKIWFESHRAGAHALGATDARAWFLAVCVGVGENGHAIGTFNDRYFDRRQSLAHHRTSSQYFIVSFRQSAASVDQL